jgi:hypothetical protein
MPDLTREQLLAELGRLNMRNVVYDTRVPETLREQIIAEYMKTPEGLVQLAHSTIEPARIALEQWTAEPSEAALQDIRTVAALMERFEAGAMNVIADFTAHRLGVERADHFAAREFMHLLGRLRQIRYEQDERPRLHQTLPTAWARVMADEDDPV